MRLPGSPSIGGLKLPSSWEGNQGTKGYTPESEQPLEATFDHVVLGVQGLGWEGHLISSSTV